MMTEQPAVERLRFTKDHLDRMVREADRCRDAVIRLSPLDDVCTHVKALAAEVEQWQKDYLACEQERSQLRSLVVNIHMNTEKSSCLDLRQARWALETVHTLTACVHDEAPAGRGEIA